MFDCSGVNKYHPFLEHLRHPFCISSNALPNALKIQIYFKTNPPDPSVMMFILFLRNGALSGFVVLKSPST